MKLFAPPDPDLDPFESDDHDNDCDTYNETIIFK